MALLEDTQQLLKRTRKHMSLRAIAEASDGDVQLEWLRKFCYGEISDPSVNRIQTLHDFLKKIAKPN